jgi:hypothetical protein
MTLSEHAKLAQDAVVFEPGVRRFFIFDGGNT